MQAHFVREEKMKVVVDLKLPGNEVILFTPEEIFFADRLSV